MTRQERGRATERGRETGRVGGRKRVKRMRLSGVASERHKQQTEQNRTDLGTVHPDVISVMQGIVLLLPAEHNMSPQRIIIKPRRQHRNSDKRAKSWHQVWHTLLSDTHGGPQVLPSRPGRFGPSVTSMFTSLHRLYIL